MLLHLDSLVSAVPVCLAACKLRWRSMRGRWSCCKLHHPGAITVAVHSCDHASFSACSLRWRSMLGRWRCLNQRSRSPIILAVHACLCVQFALEEYAEEMEVLLGSKQARDATSLSDIRETSLLCLSAFLLAVCS